MWQQCVGFEVWWMVCLGVLFVGKVQFDQVWFVLCCVYEQQFQWQVVDMCYWYGQVWVVGYGCGVVVFVWKIVVVVIVDWLGYIGGGGDQGIELLCVQCGIDFFWIGQVVCVVVGVDVFGCFQVVGGVGQFYDFLVEQVYFFVGVFVVLGNDFVEVVYWCFVGGEVVLQVGFEFVQQYCLFCVLLLVLCGQVGWYNDCVGFVQDCNGVVQCWVDVGVFFQFGVQYVDVCVMQVVWIQL